MFKIRHLYIFIVTIFISSFILSCNKDPNNTPANSKLIVNPSEFNFSAEGGFKVMSIAVDNEVSWEVSNLPSWINLSASSGVGNKTLNLNAIANDTEQSRSATAIVSTNEKSVDLQLMQDALIVEFSASPLMLNFDKAGSTQNLTITIGLQTAWSIKNNPSWLNLSASSGVGPSVIEATASPNQLDANRSSTFIIESDNQSIEVRADQDYEGGLYPNYNINPLPFDNSGMTSTAEQIAAQITLGWNIGNSLEATGSETSWGNPLITKDLIDLVKDNGFNAIRLPCAWNQYLSDAETAKIDDVWLKRVSEVIDYCIDNDLYVLLNIHWDGGWLENNVTAAKQDENNAKQKAFWEQIATYLRDYDEHLLFASANEPNVENASDMEVLDSYHQTFVDAVRSTGGKNAYRTLVIQGPSTDIEKTNTLMTQLPTDNTSERLMAEVHFYTPWNFCGLEEDASWGDMFFYWGKDHHASNDASRNATWGEEAQVDILLESMKVKFVDQGIPVILGEFGAIRRTNLMGENLSLHLESRAYYIEYLVRKSKANGILPFYWDEGNLGNHGFGIFDRYNNTISDQRILKALQDGLN